MRAPDGLCHCVAGMIFHALVLLIPVVEGLSVVLVCDGVSTQSIVDTTYLKIHV